MSASTSTTRAIKRSVSLLGQPSSLRTPACLQCRHLHRPSSRAIRIPAPTPFVPDVSTFLTLIGRGMAQHAGKIPSWEALFSLSSQQLKESGLEPARARRYLLWWRERFRRRIFGIGGDLKEVKDGVAELRIVEVPSDKMRDRAPTLTKDAGTRKLILNLPATVKTDEPAESEELSEEEGTKELRALPVPLMKVEQPPPQPPIAGVKIVRANVIAGTGVEPVKGHPGVAHLKIRDGLWEERRGHKVDGGERRKKMVRSKKRGLERKNSR